jgi:cytochrome P450
VAETDLLDTAVEEFLRAYSPVTMARHVVAATEIAGQAVCPGDKVLLTFPAANRDPAHFDRADEVLIDRQRNRHMAFGAGIHRCLGSNLARMELRVALERWLDRIPEFELVEGADVRWNGGQVRGPRSVPVTFPT